MIPRKNFFRNRTSIVMAALLVFTIVFPSAGLAQKGEEQPPILIGSPAENLAPAPIFISGNPSCSTLNASSNPAFAHIVENYELKLDFGSPNGQYFFTTGQPGVVLTGPADPTKSVSVSSSTGNIFPETIASGSPEDSFAASILSEYGRESTKPSGSVDVTSSSNFSYSPLSNSVSSRSLAG
ncbi:hypothetical protein [Leptolyngbya sp. 7M]|uniref:hypothetical protein n=1 Tax=Leptolyngbya sp. 7M TaxID=2812896 RepID=UPI001CEDCAE1|nr:hypothetical protein [Leptolyngbya sp. 7M]